MKVAKKKWRKRRRSFFHLRKTNHQTIKKSNLKPNRTWIAKAYPPTWFHATISKSKTTTHAFISSSHPHQHSLFLSLLCFHQISVFNYTFHNHIFIFIIFFLSLLYCYHHHFYFLHSFGKFFFPHFFCTLCVW